VCAECGIRAESVVDALHSRWKQAASDFESAKLCTRCGAKYDNTGACSNRPCQGGVGEWCLEHHGAPFFYGIHRQ